MKIAQISYSQLRAILSLVVKNEPIRVKLDDVLAGKELHLTEGSLLETIIDSEIDQEIIRILTGKDPGELDAFDGIEVISDFFGYMKANSARLKSWLSSIGSKAAPKPRPTTGKSSK